MVEVSGSQINLSWKSHAPDLDGFVLVRLLDATSFNVIPCVAIGRQLLQVEVLYIHRAYAK